MKISSKYFNIMQFQELIEASAGVKEYQILFMTAYGLVTGDMISYQSFEAHLNEPMDEMMKAFVLENADLVALLPLVKAKILLEKDNVELTGGGVLLPLENVKIYKNSLQEEPVLQSATFYLHADDVIGFSIVSRQ